MRLHINMIVLILFLKTRFSEGWKEVDCFCSGVTHDCREAEMYWSTLRIAVNNNNSGFLLVDRDQNIIDGRAKFRLSH